jgi:hypothetical protein
MRTGWSYPSYESHLSYSSYYLFRTSAVFP